MGVPTQEELQTALQEAASMREQDRDPHYLAKVLLNHHYQLEKLNKVLEAAELYLHSGHAGHEHAELMRAIEDAKRAKSDTGDHNELDFGL
jgi:hypothetical protein